MTKYPEGLLNWAGHRAGGVRRLFDLSSGRPTQKLIQTGLLSRLDAWASSVAKDEASAPRAVLLVGGPGNGKTEAVEQCLRRIDELASLGGHLINSVSRAFASGSGHAMPRLVAVNLPDISGGRIKKSISIVQDASVIDGTQKGEVPAQLFLSDVGSYCLRHDAGFYIACINRGVIDDALARAIDQGLAGHRKLLEEIIHAVGLSSDAPSAWPLSQHSHVAVWPMDMESLLVPSDAESDAPAAQLLDIATASDDWPAAGSCIAREACPFCYSRECLANPRVRDELLKLLRWYELASGKRWNFRDLGSLVSYLLANITKPLRLEATSPCEWAARIAEIDKGSRVGPKRLQEEAIYLLVSAQYQHALFASWPRQVSRSLRRDIQVLGLDKDKTLMGLYHFLHGQRTRSIPAALEPQLKAANELLDPALSDPDEPIQLTTNTRLALRDLDARFSQSVAEGLAFIRKYRVLSPLEIELLSRLAVVDRSLSENAVRNKRPAAASRIQMQVRDFACRLVRRSIGVRVGNGKDAALFDRFQKLVEGDLTLNHEMAKEIERLLNDGERFTITLNTTFGEPAPPVNRRAMLTAPKQRVRSLSSEVTGRPHAVLRFLKVGQGTVGQSVPLTFELFKSVQELSEGMLPAALPRTVVALLDTTRARLSGQIVRDEEQLDGAEIRIGTKLDVVGREMNNFVVRRGLPK